MELKTRKNIMILPSIWKIAERIAKKENRSISNYIGCLILKDAKKRHMN